MKFQINLDNDHEVQIGAHIIYVKFVSVDHSRLDGNHGCYLPKEFTIFINKDDPDTIKLSTYFHELAHVVEHIYTVELDHIVLNLVSESLAQVVLGSRIVPPPKKTK